MKLLCAEMHNSISVLAKTGNRREFLGSFLLIGKQKVQTEALQLLDLFRIRWTRRDPSSKGWLLVSWFFAGKSHDYDQGKLANSLRALGWRQRWAVLSKLVTQWQALTLGTEGTTLVAGAIILKAITFINNMLLQLPSLRLLSCLKTKSVVFVVKIQKSDCRRDAWGVMFLFATQNCLKAICFITIMRDGLAMTFWQQIVVPLCSEGLSHCFCRAENLRCILRSLHTQPCWSSSEPLPAGEACDPSLSLSHLALCSTACCGH